MKLTGMTALKSMNLVQFTPAEALAQEMKNKIDDVSLGHVCYCDGGFVNLLGNQF